MEQESSHLLPTKLTGFLATHILVLMDERGNLTVEAHRYRYTRYSGYCNGAGFCR